MNLTISKIIAVPPPPCLCHPSMLLLTHLCHVTKSSSKNTRVTFRPSWWWVGDDCCDVCGCLTATEGARRRGDRRRTPNLMAASLRRTLSCTEIQLKHTRWHPPPLFSACSCVHTLLAAPLLTDQPYSNSVQWGMEADGDRTSAFNSRFKRDPTYVRKSSLPGNFSFSNQEILIWFAEKEVIIFGSIFWRGVKDGISSWITEAGFLSAESWRFKFNIYLLCPVWTLLLNLLESAIVLHRIVKYLLVFSGLESYRVFHGVVLTHRVCQCLTKSLGIFPGS